MTREYWPLWGSLKADTVRYHGRYSSVKFLRSVFSNRNFRAVVTMRLCQHFSKSHGPARILLLLARMAHTWTVHYAGIDLPWNTVIGPGFRITHGWGLVISHGAEIGCNVTVFHGTTIGQADRIGSNNERVTSYPIIEDSVWIGPHAIIVGGVRIGRGSRITGGTFVIHNVAAFSLVGGNPMRILRKRVMPDVVNPADVSSKVDEP